MSTFLAIACVIACANDPLPKGALARVQLHAAATATFTPEDDHFVGRYYDGGFTVVPLAADKIADEAFRRESEGDCAISRGADWIVVKAGKDAPTEVLKLPLLQRSCAFGASGKPVAVTDDGARVLMHAEANLVEHECETGNIVRKVSCNNGRLEIVRWLTNGAAIFKHGIGSPDPKDVAPVLKVFLEHNTSAPTIPLGEGSERVASAAVTNDNRTLAVVYGPRHRYSDKTVLYDLQHGKVLRYLSRDMVGSDHCVSFGSTSSIFAAGGGIKPAGANSLVSQGSLRIYNSETGTLKGGVTFGTEPIISVNFSSDDSKFLTASASGEIVVWDTAQFVGIE